MNEKLQPRLTPNFRVMLSRLRVIQDISAYSQDCRNASEFFSLLTKDYYFLLTQHISRERAILNRMRTLALVHGQIFGEFFFSLKKPRLLLFVWLLHGVKVNIWGQKEVHFHQTLLTKKARKTVYYQKEKLHREKSNVMRPKTPRK